MPDTGVTRTDVTRTDVTRTGVTFTGVPERIEVDAELVVRRYVDSDIPALVAVVNADLDHLRPWMPWAQQPATLEGQLDWFRTSSAGWEAGHDFPYGVFLRGDVVGGTGFHVRNGPGVLEIGYWLSAAYEGRGIMSRVVRRLTEVARDIPGVTRLEIHCDAGNARSRAVAQRLGYRLDRTARVEPAAPGETGRHEFWALDLDRPTRTPPR